MNNQALYHHGIKGQQWGVRRYQYADGTLTPSGVKRYQGSSKLSSKLSEAVNKAKTKITGKQYVDGYLDKGTNFNRIQSQKKFEKFAFYATYNQDDSDKYMGLFGKNLTDRANYAAKKAEKVAEKTQKRADIKNAKELRETADSMKVYQLTINATRKLKIPSDENAGDITAKLLKEQKFRDNVIESISDSKSKMRRPAQQLLLKQAQDALEKETDRLTKSEKIAIYKALNLSLTNHNAQEIEAQNRFYSELKKKGYNALLDYNDKQYSSYHAKRPMIVFDTSSVRLKAVTETKPDIVKELNKKYNKERSFKEVSANTIGYVAQLGATKMSYIESYMYSRTETYLNK